MKEGFLKVDSNIYNSDKVIKKGSKVYSDGSCWCADESCEELFLFGVYTFSNLECINEPIYKKECIESLYESIDNLPDGKLKDEYKNRLKKFSI